MRFAPVIPVGAAVALVALALVVCVIRRRRGASRVCVARSLGAVAFVGIIVANPLIGGTDDTNDVTGLDVLVVVDTTGSMAAEDQDGTSPRLDGVRADLHTLVDGLAGATFALVTFDSSPQIAVPWTTDAVALGTAVDVLRQERTYYATGSRLDAPADAMARLLPRRGAPDAEERRTVVVFVSDGEQTVGDGWRSYAPFEEYVDDGIVLGYGTAAGGRMQVFTGRDLVGDAYIFDDRTGADAVSRIDEDNLTTIADQLGVGYLRRTEPGQPASTGAIDDVVAGIVARADHGAGTRPGERPLAWIAALGLVGVVMWQASVTAGIAAGMRRAFRSPAGVST